ncbi:sugar:cation symporter [Rhodobacteraceae bacterium WD3A24]|nr:sugar:cation symporter [Rhodobacteraceae bacterium WD3A24]
MAGIAISKAGAATSGLPRYALFGGVLAAAGLPIYIHAPKFYVDEYGVGLGALGAVLFALRLVDVVQDPALGWLAEATRGARGAAAAIAGCAMAVAMLALFAVAPPVAPLPWFAGSLLVLFSAFSFLTITFYAQGVAKARDLGAQGHLRVAAWREGGALIGVCAAAAAPAALMAVTDAPFAAFALIFAAAALAAVLAMRPEWHGAARAVSLTGFATLLGDRTARRLLVLALVNSAPVAVTSTLFLFFVESRLMAAGSSGPLLIVFFLAAAASVPAWSRAAARLGAKPALMAAMALAILSFGFAALLGPGDVALFAVICLASGAAVGADLTLLPAIFARRIAAMGGAEGQAFGLWAFMTKFTLAIAAVALLPALEAAGFRSGTDNPQAALMLLTALYALLPCVLKLVAIALLAATPVEET